MAKLIPGVNDLATVNPELAKEWHPTKNGDLKPSDVSGWGHQKVWWLGKCGHEWEQRIYSRTQGSGCPVCSRQKQIVSYVRTKIDQKGSLFDVNPELASEWHPTKNEGLTPDMVTAGSNRKVWWLGSCGHEWQASVVSRNKGHGCPICFKEMQTSFAEQAVFYYVHQVFPDAINRDVSFGKEIDVYIPSLRIGIEYDGSRYHVSVEKDMAKNEFFANLGVRLIRIREVGCPKIDVSNVILCDSRNDDSLNHALIVLFDLLGVSNIPINVVKDHVTILNNYILQRKENSLASQYPELAKEWHPTKNGNLMPDMVLPASMKRVWWQCSKGHEWLETVNKRTSMNIGCPYCSNHRVWPGFNDLATTHPALAKEWHPTKNGDLKPTDISFGSERKVWWFGSCGHEWCDTPNSRTSKSTGCPYCSGRRVLKGFNDLKTINPILAEQWHPTKNGDLIPENVSPGSGEKVWWLGSCGHEWQAAIYSRAKDGNGCPFCGRQHGVQLRRHTLIERRGSLLDVYPELAKEWHPEKNGTLTPADVTCRSGKRVWWLGKCGHEWQATIAHRVDGTECPFCAKNHKRMIVNLDTGDVFNSAKEAAVFCGLRNSDNVSACCRGESKTAGGYHWKYVEK